MIPAGEASDFPPDAACVDAVRPSPNHGPRPTGARIDMLVLHYTNMASGEEALARLRDSASEVSSHYLVMADGRVLQLVSEASRAWHAGISFWLGETDLNSCSFGIEIDHPGHAGGRDGSMATYPEAQMASVIELCGEIVARHAIPAERVLGHSDIAPGRKEDPGETFPWDALHAAGIGRWVPPEPIVPGPTLGPGDRGRYVYDLQMGLAEYGYEIDATGIYDDETALAVTAFQRHFRPAQVDGLADSSTRATLAALAALPAHPGGSLVPGRPDPT